MHIEVPASRPKANPGGMVTARATIVIDDPHVRVTTWTFDEAGHATGPHVHEYDYIVVPVTGGTFMITDGDGITREMTEARDRLTAVTPAPTTTSSARTDGPVVFVEVELEQ